MIQFHSLHVALKQDYLHSIHFNSFIFKTSNQGYLIPFHFILFHSFPLLKYIIFHSFPFPYDHFIPFPYELPNGPLVFSPFPYKKKKKKILLQFFFLLFSVLFIWFALLFFVHQYFFFLFDIYIYIYIYQGHESKFIQTIFLSSTFLLSNQTHEGKLKTFLSSHFSTPPTKHALIVSSYPFYSFLNSKTRECTFHSLH